MLNVAVKAARAAGALINRAALDVEAVRVSVKQTNDFVTEVDKSAEAAIIETLLTAYPMHGILAEESGSIELIDWHIYERVLASIPQLTNPSHYVALNVSARHFRSPYLAERLLELLDAYEVSADRIRIEVTEGALLENPDQARQTMLRLRDAGVLCALDDFGTGYSSLSYLHRFPLYGLKIDRSFVADLNPDLSGSSAAVVRAIRALAGSLNMEVIAEGIENTMQRDALLRLDCQLGQGFLFATPGPLRGLTATVASP